MSKSPPPAATGHLAIVLYQGFVHTDMDGDDEPGYDEVAHVHDVFSKNSLKEIRKQHPLFARGSDDKLNFVLQGDVLRADGKEAALFETNVFKIVYVAPIKKVLYIILRRSSSAGRFSCHIFKVASEKLAGELSSTLWSMIKTAPKQGALRHTGSLDEISPTSPNPHALTVTRARALTDIALSSKAMASSLSALDEGVEQPSPVATSPNISPTRPVRVNYELFSPRGGKPATDKDKRVTMDLRVPDSKPRPDEHSNWLHASVNRKGAEDMLNGNPPGTFLVRKSETLGGGHSLSIVLRDGSCCHFKICCDHGEFYVMGDEMIKFPTLEGVVNFYYTHQITKNGDHLVMPCSAGPE